MYVLIKCSAARKKYRCLEVIPTCINHRRNPEIAGWIIRFPPCWQARVLSSHANLPHPPGAGRDYRPSINHYVTSFTVCYFSFLYPKTIIKFFWHSSPERRSLKDNRTISKHRTEHRSQVQCRLSIEPRSALKIKVHVFSSCPDINEPLPQSWWAVQLWKRNIGAVKKFPRV